MKSWEHLESEPGLEKSSLSAAVQEEPRNLSSASLFMLGCFTYLFLCNPYHSLGRCGAVCLDFIDKA